MEGKILVVDDKSAIRDAFNTSLFELADCRDAGFDDYFTKPVELKKLLTAAEDAFEKLNRWKQG